MPLLLKTYYNCMYTYYKISHYMLLCISTLQPRLPSGRMSRVEADEAVSFLVAVMMGPAVRKVSKSDFNEKDERAQMYMANKLYCIFTYSKVQLLLSIKYLCMMYYSH